MLEIITHVCNLGYIGVAGSKHATIPRGLGWRSSIGRGLSAARVALSLFFVFTFTAGAAAPVVPGTLWVADRDGIAALDSEATLILEIATEQPARAVAFDRTRDTAWALDDRGELSAVDTDGVRLHSVTVSTPPGMLVAPLVELLVDAPAATLWLLAGDTLYRFDAQGEFLGATELAPGEQPRSLALDEARSRLWLATRHELLAFDPYGANTLDIEADLPPPWVDAIAFDPFHDALWVAVGGRLQRYDGDGGKVFDIEAERVIEHADAGGLGGAWLARPDILHHIDQAGAVEVSLRPLRDLQGAIQGLAADPLDGAVWVARPRRLGRYGPDGSLQVITDRNRIRLAELVMVKPSTVHVTITEPEAGDLTNQNPPEVRLAVEGLPVAPGDIVLSDFGVDIQAACEALGDGAFLCVASDELPQGDNELVAAVSNAAGTRFASAPVVFAIDSIPPAIALDFPPADHVINVEVLELAGTLSEAAKLLVNGESVTVGDDLAFQTMIELEEGANLITLEVTDTAGNRVEHDKLFSG